jgi:hypothetical protein
MDHWKAQRSGRLDQGDRVNIIIGHQGLDEKEADGVWNCLRQYMTITTPLCLILLIVLGVKWAEAKQLWEIIAGPVP